MALIKCKGCGRPVSRKAAACPHCGEPIRKSKGCGRLVLLLILTPVVLVTWLVTVVGSGGNGLNKASEDAFYACKAFTDADMGTCAVARPNVVLTINTSQTEAAKICAGTVQMINAKTRSLAQGKWRLRLVSPFDETRILAECGFQ